MNVASPTSALELGFRGTPTNAEDVFVVGNTVYVAGGP